MKDKYNNFRLKIITIIGTLFILVAALLFYQTIKKTIVSNEQDNMLAIVSVSAGNLKTCLQAKSNLIRGAFLGDMADESDIRQSLLKVGEKGQYISREESEFLIEKKRKPCEKAAKSPGEVIASSVSAGGNESHLLYLTKAVYINRSIAGYVQIELDLEQIYKEEQALSDVKLSNQGYYIIKNKKGDTIVPNNGINEKIRIAEIGKQDKGCMVNWLYEVREGTPKRMRKLVAYEKIQFKGESFTLCIIENYDEVIKPIERISLFLCVLAIMLCAWIAFFLYKVIKKQKEEEQLKLELKHEKELNCALKKQEGFMEKYNHQKTIGVLTGAIAHEFNNLMTPIVLYSELFLENDEVKAEMREEVEELYSSAIRCEILAKQLLDYNRQGKVEKILTNYNATFALQSSVSIVKRILPDNIKLEINICKKSYYIRGQLGAINQIVLNLVSNAIYAMAQGGSLSIDFGLCKRKDTMVRLIVKDSGVGIEKETSQHIFEPFFTTKTESEGMGIGLTVVRSLVEEHRGYIYVETELGKGTTFILDFPKVVVKE